MVRTRVATGGCALLGTRQSTFRMKCVRHRCQAAPGSVAPIAETSPLWESETTSLTPESPRPQGWSSGRLMSGGRAFVHHSWGR